MPSESGSRVVKTICNMCLDRCGINVYVENGKIVRVAPMQEHPYNTLCVKAQAIPELVYSSERLTNPLRKIDGKFREVSWDEAFDFIADKLDRTFVSVERQAQQTDWKAWRAIRYTSQFSEVQEELSDEEEKKKSLRGFRA